jgi:hypothetical protein
MERYNAGENAMISFIKGMLSDPNGVPDDARIMAVIACLAFVFCVVWRTVVDKTFDPLTVGAGFGAMFAATGLYLRTRGDK